ncbi:Putative cell wall binding repeat 2 [Quadrisphaera granulorum]|uniref:Putative cell wall binding repeat protein n=1 Tax=Quadrisphaera granulorum TaxID=317664 RepID=A0A315ZSC0_9ACTN|nr:cell wall-binding repeat-containing protein [Quadrisphaera granulorum]PWJ48461.1 putative cell wall binding repeat protein [Quadrisphaera granulorum]SZE98420.1 Putative cell wall binding repeat 2 [Quadrisphaera granulorum]
MTTTTRARRARAATIAALVAGGLLAAATPAQAVTIDRWSGGDRHATAAAVSTMNFQSSTKAVVVVNGNSFADALAAAPLAASLKAPLLTVTADQVPTATSAEIERLAPQLVWVVGGTTAISEGVTSQLDGLSTGGTIRLAGNTRYATAARVSEMQFLGAQEVYVASGEGFADALAAGAAAASKGVPLMLTNRDSLPSETADMLKAVGPTRITIVGGTTVVSAAVQAKLEADWPGKVRRIYGDDRYDTAAKVLKDLGSSAPSVLLASGVNFPDALAGAALGKPLLLSRPDCLPQVTADAYTALGTTSVTGLGGSDVLSNAALAGTVCVPAALPEAAASASSSEFENCTAVRAAGKAPLRRGQPGYSSKLDRDGDGIACE